MNTYHLLYKEDESQFYSTGYNILTDSPENAIKQWRIDHPEAYFLACYIKEF